MNINININILIILVALLIAMLAVYVLYAIIMPKGNDLQRDKEFELTTKNIKEHVKTLFDKGEYALVQLLATKYLERMPSNNEVRQYLAHAYFKDKKYNNSIKQCLMILKRNPNNAATRRILGDCYIEKGLLNKAIKEYEELYETKNQDKDVLKTLAKLYKDTDQIHSAIAIYNMLNDLATENDEIAEIQTVLAELNVAAHDYPAAFEAYKTKLGIYPTDYETNKKLTELYIKINNQQKAIETLLYMLSFVTDPKNLQWVYENLISIYASMEEYEKAIDYSKRLLDIQGSDKFKIQNDIAMFNLKLNHYAEGISILEELVMISQSAFDVTVELADAYISQKEYQKALDKYTALLDRATQKEAKDVRALICRLYISWADEMAAQKNYEQSNKYLETASDYNPLDSEIYYHKALNQYALKNYSSCIEFIHSAMEYDKFGNYKTKYLLKLAEAHHQLGNLFEEKKALNDLLKIDPQNPMGLYYSGLMYVSQHDSKSAEENFLKALEYQPDLIKAKYNLALIYENNNREKAKELFMEVLEEDPSFDEAKRAFADFVASEY